MDRLCTVVNTIHLSVDKYPFNDWSTYTKNKSMNILDHLIKFGWESFFTEDIIRELNEINDELICKAVNNVTIFPYPKLVFSVFNMLTPDRIKVVIVGQDPYFEYCNGVSGDTRIPQAMGLSFSVPDKCILPPSLMNMFKNAKKFNHIKSIAPFMGNGNLSYLVLQGVFLVNTALTVTYRDKASHMEMWRDFTCQLIQYISDNLTNVVFLSWGKPAHEICLNVNPDKHCIITSSHPSPLGSSRTFSGKCYKDHSKTITYPPFDETDHFGLMNKYLTTKGMVPVSLERF